MNESENLRSDNLDENLEEEVHLTVKEAANYINERPGVVRNWMRELKAHIPTIQGENGYHYFDRPALERLLLIKQLSRGQNYSIKQIEYHFNGGDVKSESQTDASAIILNELHNIKEQIDLQRNFNEVLVQQLKKQQQHMDHQQKIMTESLNKHEEQFLIAFRESQQPLKEASPTIQNNGFFSRLFKKRATLE